MKNVISFENFYQNMGIEKYPFALFTTENELEIMDKLFVEPLDYAQIKDGFKNNVSMVIIGNRGTGKTAILNDLKRHLNANCISCNIDDFSRISEESTITQYYELILRSLTEAIFESVSLDQSRLKKLDKDEKLLLSCLLKTYTDDIYISSLKEKIEKIQIGKIGGFVFLFNKLRFLLNYGASVGANSFNIFVSQFMPSLPPISDDTVRNVFPEWKVNVTSDFETAEATYSLLKKTIRLVKKMGFEKITIMLDKIDEDSRLDNDAESISEFILPVLTDNKLLLNNDVQFILFMWEVPYNLSKDKIRTQKHSFPMLKWKRHELAIVLNRRLDVFSDKKVTDFKFLFHHDIDQSYYDDILTLSNANPRDLWHLMNIIFKTQYEIDNTSSTLTRAAVKKGINTFVTTFNFYEYYPRKKASRANSMDVYSYIAHISKLDGIKFTKNKLSDSAGTGSSTPNYVTGMENIGLIVKTDEKIQGGTVYEVIDPKVVYAVLNKLDIGRS